MPKYKVDWLAFSVSLKDEEQTLDPQLLKILGYDLQILTKSQAIFTTRGNFFEIM